MVSAVVAIHVSVCIALCIVILLQHGKGADIGAVFGGSSQTVFGAGGAGNALTKATTALAVVFFATSLFLAYASSRRVTASVFDNPMPKSAAPSKPAPAGTGGAAPGSPANPAPASSSP